MAFVELEIPQMSYFSFDIECYFLLAQVHFKVSVDCIKTDNDLSFCFCKLFHLVSLTNKETIILFDLYYLFHSIYIVQFGIG